MVCAPDDLIGELWGDANRGVGMRFDRDTQPWRRQNKCAAAKNLQEVEGSLPNGEWVEDRT
jgi:hypothetical protein